MVYIGTLEAWYLLFLLFLFFVFMSLGDGYLKSLVMAFWRIYE